MPRKIRYNQNFYEFIRYASLKSQNSLFHVFYLFGSSIARLIGASVFVNESIHMLPMKCKPKIVKRKPNRKHEHVNKISIICYKLSGGIFVLFLFCFLLNCIFRLFNEFLYWNGVHVIHAFRSIRWLFNWRVFLGWLQSSYIHCKIILAISSSAVFDERSQWSID